MKKYLFSFGFAALFFLAGTLFSSGRQKQETGYILEHEKDIAASETGPHKGGGMTTAFKFFSKASGSKLDFRKRILHPGSSIGYHLQKEEEIYYIVSGSGEMKMNGNTFLVKQGDAILTHPGNSHGLKPTGNADLAVIIMFEKK